LRNHQGFKQTEIGKIPEEWYVAPLKEIVEINKESIDPAKDFPNDRFLYIDIDSVENEKGVIRNAKEIIGKSAPSRARRLIHRNNVLMSTVRPYLKAFTIVPKQFNNQICSTGFAVLTCGEKLLPLFLLYSLFAKSVIDQCKKMMVGGQYPALNSSQVSNIKLLLPPLPEQKKIAEILSTVDQAIEKVDEAIEKTQRLKKGLMQELLTRGIGNKEFKDTEIGRIPKEWEAVKIKDLGKVFTGKTPSTTNPAYWGGDIPFITPADIKEAKYIYQTERNVSQEGAQRIGYTLPNETVLVVCIGSTIGKTGLTNRGSITNQQINAVVCNSKTNPHFVYYAITLRSEIVKSFSGVAAVPIIKKSSFEKLKLPYPQLSEQDKIAEILSTVDERLDLFRKRKERLERTKKGLMDVLLTGRKRVKL